MQSTQHSTMDVPFAVDGDDAFAAFFVVSVPFCV